MKRKIVIACDSFKGCLGSGEVASAVAEGIGRAMNLAEGIGRTANLPEGTQSGMHKNGIEGNERHGAEVVTLEVADGGEGTGRILTRILGGKSVAVETSDPLGRTITAEYGIVEATAVIEMAQASGLTLLTKEERNPLLTSTYGTGEMILDAIGKGCRRFLIGIGGSATNDGGTGMLVALGFRFTDRNGKLIEGCCGGRLEEITDIDSSNVPQEILESEFIVACDVTTPFSGDEGASRVFSRQKGADDDAMETLEKGMQSFARVISRKYGIDLNEIPGTGAAGGLGGAFKACLNAELKSGIDMILDAAGFDEIIEGASLVITGEGRIDFQSGKGKVIDGICRRCRAKSVPVLAIAGIVESYNESMTVLPIGPRPQNERDLEHAMRPEVARKNISDAIAKYLPELL